MSDLNQYAISKTLGSRMVPGAKPRFGNFGLIAATADALALPLDGEQPEVSFTYKDDAIIVRAFEETRNGAPTDRLLWDKLLTRKFHRRCRELGINAAGKLLTRRLINIRKNKERYASHGIAIEPTSEREPHVSIVPKYAHVIEFALVRLRYRYGASIDDVLMDPDLGDEFEKIAQTMSPELPSMDLRIGALYLRKTRFFRKSEVPTISQLDIHLLDSEWQNLGSLTHVTVGKLDSVPGLIEVKERDRFLYVARNEDVRVAVDQFAVGNPFGALANGFWQPDPNILELRVISGDRVKGVPSARWALKLIQELKPVFNLPLAA